jgi:hypothetical protein
MFRLLLDHLQALWENRSKNYLYFNALWDPKCLQTVLYECEIHKFVYIGMCVAVQYIQIYVFNIHITQSVSIWDPTMH